MEKGKTIIRRITIVPGTTALFLLTKSLALTAVLTMNDGTMLTLTEAGYLDRTLGQGPSTVAPVVTYLQWGTVRLVEGSRIHSIAFSYANGILTKSITLKSGSVPTSLISDGLFCMYGVSSDLNVPEMFCNYAGKAAIGYPFPSDLRPLSGGYGNQATNLVFKDVAFQP